MEPGREQTVAAGGLVAAHCCESDHFRPSQMTGLNLGKGRLAGDVPNGIVAVPPTLGRERGVNKA
jgi:hypothetical protein